MHVWGFPGTYFRYLGSGDRDVIGLPFGHRRSQRKKARALASRVISFLLLFFPSMTLDLTATRRLKRPKLKMEERLRPNDVKQTTSRVIQVRVSEFN